ncbi:MAG: DUF1553 domain-containing protein [Planctomycetaceae bacterium]
MKHTSQICLPALLLIFGVSFTLAEEAAPQTPNEVTANTDGLELFEKQILPVLVNHCYECHSKDSETIEGGLELDSPSGMLRGGDSGPMMQAHHAEKSELLRMLRHDEGVSGMPPEERLSDEVLAAFEEWIRLGAPDSREDTGPTAKEQRLNKSKGHWAFQPPVAVPSPAVTNSEWARDPMIDSFVLAKLEEAGLAPVADANRQTLVRRVYFDLIGLPPTPQQVAEFVADESPDALANLVNRLLDSPQFGERWGRHWLDVVRYAESSGMEFNFTYPHAWPYRDYVIDSFNADKPFDMFLREQIAGDLLSGQEGDSPETIEARNIAPSILAFGPKRHNSGGAEFQMDIADDQIDVVFKSMQAMTVSCARCHDHKFDPIPQKDYYALAGIFLSTMPRYGTIQQKYSNNPTELLPFGENARAMHETAEAHEKQIAEAEQSVTTKKEELTKAEEAEKLALTTKTEAEELLAAFTSRLEAEATVAETTTEETPEKDSSETEETGAEPVEEVSTTTNPEQLDATAKLAEAVAKSTEATAQLGTLKDELAKLEASVTSLKESRPPRPKYAMTVSDREAPADTKLAIRGDFRTPGDVVPRGFLSAVHVPDASPVDPTHSGRMELAEWIANPRNPLTARVMVNRIWHHLLGRGIVPTVDNFGMLGKPPTHPELLDYLALRFIEEGWSVKSMIRAIVLSRTYQLSSHVDEQHLTADPDNRLLWRATPRRLEAEAIRDAILAVSGQLDPARQDGSTVTGLGDRLAREIPTEQIQPANVHRSVYLPVVRDYIPEVFDLFDFPSPSLVTGQRAITNVPSQALYLRNSTFVAEQARHAAERLMTSPEATDDAGRVALAMQWALGRTPTAAESEAALQLVHEVQQAETPASDETTENGADPKLVNGWSAWFLTLFTTAEFRYLVDIGD